MSWQMLAELRGGGLHEQITLRKWVLTGLLRMQTLAKWVELISASLGCTQNLYYDFLAGQQERGLPPCHGERQRWLSIPLYVITPLLEPKLSSLIFLLQLCYTDYKHRSCDVGLLAPCVGHVFVFAISADWSEQNEAGTFISVSL